MIKRTFEDRKRIVQSIIDARKSDPKLSIRKAAEAEGISVASYNLWKNLLKQRKSTQTLLVPSEGLRITPQQAKCIVVVSDISVLPQILKELNGGP